MLVCEPIEISLDDVVVSIAEDDAPAWDALTSWELGDRVVRNHQVYQSMEAANVGTDPALVDQTLTDAKWLLVGYSNAYSAFDGVLSNPTIASETLTIEIDVDEAFDILCLFGVRATLVEARFLNAAGSVISTRSKQMGGLLVSGWLEWFTTAPTPRRDKVVFDRLPVAARRVEIEITGGPVRLGEVFLGNSYYVGEAQPATRGASQTSSRYEINDFGRTTWLKRPTRRNMTYVVDVGVEAFESVEPLMARLAGSLVATVGGIDRSSMVQFGILGTIEWSEDMPDSYLYSFSIKGIS